MILRLTLPVAALLAATAVYAQTPVLRGGVSYDARPFPVLQLPGPGGYSADVRALDRCNRLGRNALQAPWSATPNRAQCQQARAGSSGSATGSAGSDPFAGQCWAAGDQAFAALVQAEALFEQARHTPSPGQRPLMDQGRELQQQARSLLVDQALCTNQAITQGGPQVGQGQPRPQPGPQAGAISDPHNWGAGFAVGLSNCFQAFGNVAQQVAGAMSKGEFVKARGLLGLPANGANLTPMFIEQLRKDMVETKQVRIGGPGAGGPTDYEIGMTGGFRFCSWAVIPGATRVGGIILKRAAVATRAATGRFADRFLPRRAPGGAGDETLVLTPRQVNQVMSETNAPAKVSSTRAQQVGIGQSSTEAANRAIQLGDMSHTTIQLPSRAPGGLPTTVRLGEKLGTGAFGQVYEELGPQGAPTGRAVKLVHQTDPLPEGLMDGSPFAQNEGGMSVLRQVRGAQLLRSRTSVPTPQVHDWHAAQRPGEFSHVVMDKIDTTSPSIDTWGGNKFPVDVKRQAIDRTLQEVGDKGLIAADLHKNNLYFVQGADGVVRAGIWDTDFVYSSAGRDADALLLRTQTVGRLKLLGVTDAQIGAIDWSNARQVMDLMRTRTAW